MKFFLVFLSLLITSIGVSQSNSLSEDEILEQPYFYDLKEALKTPEKVYKLNLTHQQLKSFPKKILKLTELRFLLLDSNEISEIPKEIFDLKNLTILDLSYNKLEQLPPSFCELTNLSTFYISNNVLSKLPANFILMSNLINLDLSENKLNQFPIEICSLEKLINLYVSFNNIESLPREIGRLSRLKTLMLSNNIISKLPPEFFLLQNLKILSLYNNKIEEISTEFRKFTALKTLDIGYNNIKSISFLVENTNLQHLYIEFNKINIIPSSIMQLYKLEEFNISGNPLTSLPDEMNKLTNLQTLSIREINFPVFPKVLYDLNNNEIEISGFDRKELFKIKLLMSQGQNRQLTSDYNEALAKYRELLNIDSNNIMAFYQIASCYLDEKRYDSCSLICKNTIQNFPTSRVISKVKVLYNNSLIKEKKYDLADSLFYENKKSVSGISQLYLNYGKNQFIKNDDEESMINFQNAVISDSINANAHFYLALTSHILDRNTPSIFAALRFFTLESTDPRVTTFLPFLMVKMGMKTGRDQKSKKNSFSTSYSDNYIVKDENGKTIYSNKNRGVDLLTAMLVDIIDTLQNKRNNVELFKIKLKKIIETKPEERKKEDAFFWNYYAPYYTEMNSKGFLEAFAYLINSLRDNETYITKWIKDNESKINDFYAWSEAYRWSKK